MGKQPCNNNTRCDSSMYIKRIEFHRIESGS